MCASCSICHTQTFFWKNRCVSLLSDYNLYLVSSPRISWSKPFPVPCHYYHLNYYYYNGTKKSKSFPVTFPDYEIKIHKYSIFPLTFLTSRTILFVRLSLYRKVLTMPQETDDIPQKNKQGIFLHNYFKNLT